MAMVRHHIDGELEARDLREWRERVGDINAIRRILNASAHCQPCYAEYQPWLYTYTTSRHSNGHCKIIEPFHSLTLCLHMKNFHPLARNKGNRSVPQLSAFEIVCCLVCLRTSCAIVIVDTRSKHAYKYCRRYTDTAQLLCSVVRWECFSF